MAVANWLIEKNKTDKSELTHLKIQMLLYFAQGYCLGNYEMPLFEYSVLAWKYGPVVYSVYLALHSCGRREVNELIEGLTAANGKAAMGYPSIGA